MSKTEDYSRSSEEKWTEASKLTKNGGLNIPAARVDEIIPLSPPPTVS